MADLKLPPVPTTRDELLIAGLRHANDAGALLNDIDAELSRLLGGAADDPKYDAIHALLRRRFLENSGVYLFIAANNLGVELPVDLCDEPDLVEGA